MNNPWENIKLSDYENHMSLDTVYQLQALSEMMHKQLYTYDVKNIMILGIAGGNGLEHIDGSIINKVYGVDVNKDFLKECKMRYPKLQGIFEPIHADLLCEELQLPSSQLLIANLLVEYIGYECFQKVVKMVKPQYVSCIIQINTGESFVSDSPYLHAFDCLDKVHHQMEETELITCMKMIGYGTEQIIERELPNGKKFVRIDFTRSIEGRQ